MTSPTVAAVVKVAIVCSFRLFSYAPLYKHDEMALLTSSWHTKSWFPGKLERASAAPFPRPNFTVVYSSVSLARSGSTDIHSRFLSPDQRHHTCSWDYYFAARVYYLDLISS